MPIDDRTTNRSYQLPNVGNLLLEDVARLRTALQAIDADVFARYTKTEVDTLINNLISGAPGALNTLDELAAALGDDANFAATVTNALALKANIEDVYTKAQADARYVQGQVQTEMVFIATANQSVFTLSTAIINKPSALVTVDGVVQPTSEYSLNMTGTQLTLSEGVPVGTIVRVLALGVASAGAPADDTVTTAKLRDGAVTTEKIALGAVITDDLADGAVTFPKLAGSALATTSDVNGVTTTGTVTSGTTSLTVASAAGIVAGMFVVGQGITPGTTVSSIASTTVTLSANAGATLSSAPVTFYSASKVITPATVGGMLCRAWVNFNGTGTVAIRASYNVSSITDNGVGDYTVNFATAMVDANYSVVGTSNHSSNAASNTGYGASVSIRGAAAPTTGAVRIYVVDIASSSVASNIVSASDQAYVNIAIFR